MSNWKVSVEAIELFPHPTGDNLQIGKVGTYQVVVQKGLYQSGDIVAFAPEKSILPASLKEPWEKYLSGPNKDRVKAVRLRNEYSGGIIIPLETVTKALGKAPEIGVDVSEALGITQHIPPVPTALQGQVKPFDGMYNELAGGHDCEQYRVYANQFTVGEAVLVTEKLHGSQAVITLTVDGGEFITSKGLRKSGLYIQEDDINSYWKAYRYGTESLSMCLRALRDKYLESGQMKSVLRAFGELIPCQKGFSYGQVIPTIRLFDIRLDGVSIPYADVPEAAKAFWVPVLYQGPYSEETVLAHRGGQESVSGKGLHIREGIVLAPAVDRRAFDGTRLRVKVISPAYKETGEEFN